MLCFSSPTLRTGAFIYTAEIVELFFYRGNTIDKSKAPGGKRVKRKTTSEKSSSVKVQTKHNGGKNDKKKQHMVTNVAEV